MAPNITKEDNYFSIELNEGDKVAIGVNGGIVVPFIAPYASTLKCYLKSDKPAIKYE
tara:strand:+ start:576 stop:746 length:171 start_codon:yes stop_codon:yes gene_type:complete